MPFDPSSARTSRAPAGRPRRLTDVLQRKALAAQRMRAKAPAKRLPGHGHRVHGR